MGLDIVATLSMSAALSFLEALAATIVAVTRKDVRGAFSCLQLNELSCQVT